MKTKTRKNIQYSNFVAVVEVNGVIRKTLVEPFISLDFTIEQSSSELEEKLCNFSRFEDEDSHELLKAFLLMYLNNKEIIKLFNKTAENIFMKKDDQCVFLIIRTEDENDSETFQGAVELFAANSLEQGFEMMSSYANHVFLNSVCRSSTIDVEVQDDRLVFI